MSETLRKETPADFLHLVAREAGRCGGHEGNAGGVGLDRPAVDSAQVEERAASAAHGAERTGLAEGEREVVGNGPLRRRQAVPAGGEPPQELFSVNPEDANRLGGAR